MLKSLVFLAAWQAPDLEFVGKASRIGEVVRLTPAKRQQHGAVWQRNKVGVRDGFEATFRFRISEPDRRHHGADGMAFVIQNNGPTALAGRGNSGGFALGDGHDKKHKLGIANSLAVFFDTHQNEGELSGNSIQICTNGDARQMRWPPPRLGANWEPKVRLKDGRAHAVRIRFAKPLLSVYVDDVLELQAPVDLGRMVSPDGTAYIGFTAATGDGHENHDLLDWDFRPDVSSGAYAVSSNITFAPFDCLPEKALCTPAKAMVQELDANTFHVILPAHLPWSAEIPNPRNRNFAIRNARGTACWETAACGSPETAQANEPGSLEWRTRGGLIAFTLKDSNSTDNQGFYEFEVVLD